MVLISRLPLLLLLPALTLLANESPPKEQVKIEGLLKPYQEVRLASRAQGVIQFVVEEGTELKKSEVALRLEDSMEQLQLAQQTKVVEMREFENAASTALGKSDAISRIEAMEKSINLEVAKILQGQAQELLDRRTVRAPFSGVITERLRSVGEAVDEFTPVLTFVQIDQLAFETFLPADYITQIHAGDNITLYFPIFPDKSFAGTVERVSPVVNPASAEFKVRILVPNPARVLRAGLPGFFYLTPPATDSIVTSLPGNQP
jgi:membrane fusion protein (multidrug efflux system)